MAFHWRHVVGCSGKAVEAENGRGFLFLSGVIFAQAQVGGCCVLSSYRVQFVGNISKPKELHTSAEKSARQEFQAKDRSEQCHMGGIADMDPSTGVVVLFPYISTSARDMLPTDVCQQSHHHLQLLMAVLLSLKKLAIKRVGLRTREQKTVPANGKMHTHNLEHARG